MTTTKGINLMPTKAEIRLTDDTKAYLERVLEHISATASNIFRSAAERRMTLYVRAVCDLAATYDDADAQTLFDLRQNTLPSGKPVSQATSDDLRRVTLALHGLARDRAECGALARSLTTWLDAADTALAAYQRRALQPA